MKLASLSLAIVLTTMAGLSAADDGAINNKSMTHTINLPVFDQDLLNDIVPETEHTFTDQMLFYVPAQAASGLVGPIAYCDVDNQPESGEDCTNAVEVLEVAKPLVNVFVHGPAIEPEDTAFLHSFMDTYAAVSLDDGKTWKKTNLSQSADLSSFNLEEDHIASKQDPLPNDHNILLTANRGRGPGHGREDASALHAKGYETPYTSECWECHGSALHRGRCFRRYNRPCHGGNR